MRFDVDSDIWIRLIMKAEDIDGYMTDILRWYADVGVYLEENDKFGYVIKPIVLDRFGKGWSSLDEWNAEKRWLLPYAKTVAKILKELREEDELCF